MNNSMAPIEMDDGRYYRSVSVAGKILDAIYECKSFDIWVERTSFNHYCYLSIVGTSNICI